MSETLLVSIITALATGGAVTALVSWLKDRKKDTATAALTDMQTLQAKLAYVEQVANFQKTHIEDLHKELAQERESKQKMRGRVTELEEEVDKLKRQAADTKDQCDRMSLQLRAFMQDSEGEIR